MSLFGTTSCSSGGKKKSKQSQKYKKYKKNQYDLEIDKSTQYDLQMDDKRVSKKKSRKYRGGNVEAFGSNSSLGYSVVGGRRSKRFRKYRGGNLLQSLFS